ncbi:hypothetical protein ElyMa_005289300 [Elysia marginata]|uniref:Uncharacterized protein n=1 Tax=Elysia marginata TaxID=1093978 RepID=A0AAV4K0Z0_9GAST|nr:hypothetical protein ElyMa_005289300 [Elysia marginata]
MTENRKTPEKAAGGLSGEAEWTCEKITRIVCPDKQRASGCVYDTHFSPSLPHLFSTISEVNGSGRHGKRSARDGAARRGTDVAAAADEAKQVRH